MCVLQVVGMGNSACGKTCLIKHFCESKVNGAEKEGGGGGRASTQ